MPNSQETFKNDQENIENNQTVNPMQQLKRDTLSPEDLEIMKECNKESFLYRCVPFGIALIGTSQYLTNTGYLKPHPKYGALLKNITAAMLGFVLGKLSYFGKCQEKFMMAENSTFGQALRRSKKRGTNNEMMDQNEEYNRNVSTDSQEAKTKNLSSYEQLRIQNRNNYDRKNAETGPLSPDSKNNYVNISEPSKLRMPGKKNKYGDEINKDE